MREEKQWKEQGRMEGKEGRKEGAEGKGKKEQGRKEGAEGKKGRSLSENLAISQIPNMFHLVSNAVPVQLTPHHLPDIIIIIV